MIVNMLSYKLFCAGVVIDEYNVGQTVHNLVTDSNEACKNLRHSNMWTFIELDTSVEQYKLSCAKLNLTWG